MNELVSKGEAPTELAVPPDLSASAMALDERVFARVVAMGELMASAKATIPVHLRGQKGDCTAVAMQAFRWRMDPFAVAQKTHLVNGVLGYEAQLVNAAITTMAPTKDRLHFEWFGPWEKIIGKFVERESKTQKDNDGEAKKYRAPAWKIDDEAGLGVRVWATLKGEDEPRVLELLLTQARTRNSTLWADDPKQQLAYLATKRWSRLYCPDVILGVYTPDELQEERPPKNMGAAEVVDAKRTPLDEATLKAWREASQKGTVAAKAFFGKLTVEQRKQTTPAQRDELWAIALEADKKRTVDNGSAPAADAAPAAAATGAPAATDPETDEFVAAIERAEQQGGAQ